MSSRRASLAILAGIVSFPFAFWKIREVLAPYLTSASLLQIHKTPISVQPVSFAHSNGQQLGFSDFKGKHLLVNVWATWCPPCRKEMPSLDRLQAKLGPRAEPQIVAISVDPISFDQLRAFYSVVGVSNMAIYRGDQDDILGALRIVGLPTTLLIDHDGHEIGRLTGPAVWDGPEIVAQLSALATDSTTVKQTA